MIRPRHWLGLLLAVVAVGFAPAAEAQGHAQTREGFWIGFGFGYGTLGCQDCDERIGGGAGYLRMGGSLSQHVLIGGEVTGWARSEDDATLSFGVVGPVIVFYPSATGGFYLKGSIGAASLRLDLGPFSGTDNGIGASFGLGYDARVARNFSLTPFVDLVGGRFDGYNVNSAHVGLGFSFH
ncbi:MAG: hypothetical protein R2909_09470 [Gemmatimonadales bacterium]